MGNYFQDRRKLEHTYEYIGLISRDTRVMNFNFLVFQNGAFLNVRFGPGNV